MTPPARRRRGRRLAAGPRGALALRWADVGHVLVIDRAFTHGDERPTKTYSRRTVEVVAALRDGLEAGRRWRSRHLRLIS
jgi:hypothetical protein